MNTESNNVSIQESKQNIITSNNRSKIVRNVFLILIATIITIILIILSINYFSKKSSSIALSGEILRIQDLNNSITTSSSLSTISPIIDTI